MTRNQRLIVLVGLLISAFFLVLAFGALNPADVWQAVRAANPLLLGLAAVWYFAAVAVISQRWGFLLRGVKRLSLRETFPLVAIGYMGNNVYPLRTGEILRLLLLQRNHRVPMARAAVIVIVERAFDGLVMLTFILLALTVLEVNSPLIERIAQFTAPLFAIALVTFFALAARPEVLRRLAETVSRLLPGRLRGLVMHLSDEVVAGLQSLRSPRDLFNAVVFSYASWAIEASVYWLVMRAFNLNTDYTSALLVVGAVNLAGLIPASPGQVGVFEFFVVAALGLVGISETVAFAYAITVHVVIWLPVTVVGFIFLVRQGLSWNALAAARAEALAAAHSDDADDAETIHQAAQAALEERAAVN